MNFDQMKSVISSFTQGGVVVVVDDQSRENEGDFVVAAQHITPELITFFASEGRGLICTPISQKLANHLKLGPMVPHNDSCHETAFTISIDAKHNIST